MTTPIPNCPQGDEPIRDRAWTAEQPEDSRCPTTYRREGAVKTLIGLGWKWDGQQWQAEQACGVVSEEANWNPRGVTGPPIADGLLRNGSVAALLDRAAIAMPVLRNTLNAAGLKGGAIADELLADIQAVAPSLRAPAEHGGRVDEKVVTALKKVNYVLGSLANNRVVGGSFAVDDETCCRWMGALNIAGARLDDLAALAQNAQGEAVVCTKCGCEHGVAHAPYWNHKGDWTADAIWVCDKCDGERTLHLDLVTPDLHAERARVPNRVSEGWIDDNNYRDKRYVDGWNACREAMLAVAPSQPEDAA